MRMMKTRRWPVLMGVVALTLCTVDTPIAAAPQARVKDIAALQGSGSAPLLGYGLVVGLNKTGDKRQTLFTTQTLGNLLTRLGIDVAAEEMKVENTAAVLVTAELPTGARLGQRIDVIASSIGDAKSLQGGTLLLTPLRDSRGEVVAVAQGPLSVGGFGGGTGGNSVQVNHLTAGRVPGGALVQTTTTGVFQAEATEITLVLYEPDFSTAARLASALNEDFKTRVARATDAASITVAIPEEYRGQVPQLMARLEAVSVRPDAAARVVINERTGTVVVGEGVTLGPAAVAHGSLSVRISTSYDVSQPNPMAKGETVVVPNEQVDVQEGTAQLVKLDEGATLEAVTRALNALGATPRDIIAILQALKASGALRAELVIL
jgi:flagellar P-ring protein precursor FlgI